MEPFPGPLGGRLLVRDDGPVLHVRLEGAVDLDVRERDSPALWSALARAQASVVEIDAGAVTFLDSSGLSVIVRLARDAAQLGLPVRLVSTSERVDDLLAMTGVREWMAGLADPGRS